MNFPIIEFSPALFTYFLLGPRHINFTFPLCNPIKERLDVDRVSVIASNSSESL